MDRRTFIASLAAAAVYPAAARAEPGVPASPGLIDAFRSVAGISEGNGRGTLHILFAPWCHVSPQMYRDSREFLGELTFRWIPFSGGQPEGSEATERLLKSPRASSISTAFTPLQRLAAKPSTPLADAQDMAVRSRIEPQVIRDAGSGIVTPTLAYSFGSDRVRLILGGIGKEQMAEIARIAS